MVMTRNMEYAESQMKKLFYVEFLEFVCRLSKAVFTIDSKAAKRNSAVMRKLKEGAELPLSDQLAIFLSIALPNLIPDEQREDLELNIPFIDDVL